MKFKLKNILACILSITGVFFLGNLPVFAQSELQQVDWEAKIESELIKYERDGIDTISKNGIHLVNNFSWYTVFMHSDDKKQLKRTAKLMKIVVNIKNHVRYPQFKPVFIDTYANLLYKAGKKKKAIRCEELAIKIFKEVAGTKDSKIPVQGKLEDLIETLNKMKSGQKTW